MINMHSKYDNMHKNGMYYALNFTKNYVLTSINYILSFTSKRENSPRRERINFASIIARYHSLIR